LLLQTQKMYFCVAINSTCITLLLLTQHVLFDATNSTCIALLLTTQHVLQSNTCCVSSKKAIHVGLLATKQYMLS
jgi:hypothetical protein